MRPTRVQIDTKLLKENLARLKAVNGPAFFCPMIKANGYGHGVKEVAPVVAASGADAAGVALVEEGVELRRLGFKLPILVFAPLHSGDGEAIAECNLTPVAGRFEDLAVLKGATQIHIKFNTGMQRLGFDSGQLAELREKLKTFQHLTVAGVCTHLTHGEEAGNPQGPTEHQLRKFLQLSEGFPGIRHAHKSASLALATEDAKKFHPGIGARPGISIYGLPFDLDRTAAGLKPVLSWRTRLINVHEVERGETVSYGGRWTAARRSTIGVVPVGYGDGYSRALSNKGFMLFRGIKVPVAGTVCMDYVLLNLTDAEHEGRAKSGEEVVLIGQQQGAEIRAWDLAQRAGTIAYEIVTAISARVHREVV